MTAVAKAKNLCDSSPLPLNHYSLLDIFTMSHKNIIEEY